MAAPTLREWLREAPFTLTMSSGFFGFFAHTGVMTALEEADLLPERLSGSSAGALVTGLWASGLSAKQIEDELMALRREHFWDPAFGAGLLRGKLFRDKLNAVLPVTTFEKCRRPLAISIFDLQSRSTRVIEHGELAPALQASCALPFFFHPVRVEGRLASDGGIADRPGLQGIPEGTRVLYHHLASKSPWRRSSDPALQVPHRAGLTAVVLDGIPRVNPFQLERGALAFSVAAKAMRQALDRPIAASTVRLAATG